MSTAKKPRIIARLDIKGPNVIKGIRFEGLRIMGKPDELARRYYSQGADELLYIDTVASLYCRNNLREFVEEAAGHIFIPMIVGGGIRSVDDAQKLLQSGADKIAINTAAISRPEIITEMASAFGSQAVVASLEIKQRSEEKWEILVDNGREKTGINALEWAKRVEELGAGELLVTSVDRDGTGEGFEIEFMKLAANCVGIPVIAGGGAKTSHDVKGVILNTGVDAVAVASMLHYNRTTIPEIKKTLLHAQVNIASH